MKPWSPDAHGEGAATTALARSGLAVRIGAFRRLLRGIKADLRGPLPGTEGLRRPARLRARGAHLLRRYGWKILLAVFLYYLIRDSILYIILPLLVARQIAN